MRESIRRWTLAWLIAVAACLPVAAAPHPILDPAFQEQLNARTNSVLSFCDELKLLVNGAQSYPVRWRMLEGARKSILITTMYVYPDKTTERFRDLLIRKKQEGVNVKLIVYGTYALRNIPFYHALAKNGIEVRKYSGVHDVLRNPARFWTRHLHDKMFVVDGQEAIVGGMNWSQRYELGGGAKAGVAWRDTDIWLKGPQVDILEKEFWKRWYQGRSKEKHQPYAQELEALYAEKTYPRDLDVASRILPDGSAPGGYRVKGLTRFLYQQPFEEQGKAYMTPFYTDAIDRAQSRVWWQSISTRPAPQQKKALIDAAKRGVDVRLMTNSFKTMCRIPIGGAGVYAIARTYYRDLLEAGIRIFEYQGKVPMHAKGFLVDDVVAVIGSYNATFTAERYYTENGLAVYDTEIIESVDRMFEDDFANCKEVKYTPRTHRHASPWECENRPD